MTHDQGLLLPRPASPRVRAVGATISGDHAPAAQNAPELDHVAAHTPERQNAGDNLLSEPPLFPCGYHRRTTAERRALSSRHAARFSEVSATDTGGKVSSASAPKWRQQGKQFLAWAWPASCLGRLARVSHLERDR